MKIIKLFLIFVLISFVVGIGIAFNGSDVGKEEIDDFVEKYSVDEESVETSVATDKQGNEINNDQVETNIKTESEGTTNESEVRDKSQKKETDISNNAQKNESKVEEKIYQQEVVEEKKLTAWDEIGITEEEYYNSPMWKWATIDFSVNDYGSESACRNACIEAGEKSEGGYSCSTINSYSGRYLGEMLQLF